MEGSVAAPAAGADAQAQGQQDGGDAGAQAQGTPDFQAIESALEGLSTGQQEMWEQMRGFLAQQQQAEPGGDGQQEQQPTVPDINLGFLDPQSEQFDPAKAGQLLGQTIEEQIEARAKALVASEVNPVNQRLQEFVTQHEANQMAQEFPELSDEKTAAALMTSTKDLAVSVGHPELASQLWFARIVHMAGQAAKAAKEEAAEPASPATLEGASGARPGGLGALTAQQITGGRSKVLPFG